MKGGREGIMREKERKREEEKEGEKEGEGLSSKTFIVLRNVIRGFPTCYFLFYFIL